jgi:hypothetical protein
LVMTIQVEPIGYIIKLFSAAYLEYNDLFFWWRMHFWVYYLWYQNYWKYNRYHHNRGLARSIYMKESSAWKIG